MPRFTRNGLAGTVALAAVLAMSLPAPAAAQETGAVQGTVTLTETGGAVSGATIIVVGTGRFGQTDADGAYEIADVPAGVHEVLAQREYLASERRAVTVSAGGTVSADFALDLSPVQEDLTVTASAGGAETAFEAFNSVTTLEAFDIAREMQGSLGDALQNEPGVASRSFGPGSSRPVIRGFDGDRVLILEDGVRTGDLSAQSGDHGVTIDPNSAERVEIVRGPATLLYGSNAVGGLVNVITPQEASRDTQRDGTRFQFGADAGSANAQVATNVSLQHTQGNLQYWAGGSARRSGDYDTPAGSVENSATELRNIRAGLGWFGDRFFASGGATFEDGRYGVPFADEFHGAHGSGDEDHGDEDEDHGDEDEDEDEDHGDEDEDEDHGDEDEDEDHGEEEEDHEAAIDLDSRRRVGRFDFGLQNLTNPVLEGARVSVSVIDWSHDELEIEEGVENLGTRFMNQTRIVRADFDQQQTDRLSGRFGVWTQFRDFEAVGVEALAPRTDLASYAAFAYEELNFGRLRVQFGGRVERNEYRAMERTPGPHDGEDDEDHGDEDEDEDHGDEDEDDEDHGDEDEDEGEDHGDEDEDGDEDHGDEDDDEDHGDEDEDHGEGLVVPDPRDRMFMGASASIGLHADLGGGNAFVANLTRSHRAPALEELYNFGPHVGNLAFEVGNSNLNPETTIGLDLSLRHQSSRVRGDVSFFVYAIDNFIFGDRSARVVDSLPVYLFRQDDSRFRGFDARGSIRLAGRAWATLGLGYVDARLADTDQPLPRIPPLRGTLSLDIPFGSFSFGPQLMFAGKQDRLYTGETATDGYSVVNVRASYVWPGQRAAHTLTFTGHNLTNALYRNHVSFIKDLAPEMGRAFKVGYSVRLF